MMPYYLQLLL